MLSVYEEVGPQPETGISTTFAGPLNAFPFTRNRAFSLRQVSALSSLGLLMLFRLRGTGPSASDRYQHYLYLAFKCFSVYKEPGLQPQTGISTTFQPQTGISTIFQPQTGISTRETRPSASDRYQHYLHLAVKCFSFHEEPGLQPQIGTVSVLPSLGL